MKKTVILILAFFILIGILYLINHSSNKIICKNATIDLIKYKDGLQKMIILCESLISENNATEVWIDYRVGQDSIQAVYTSDNESKTQVSKKINRETVTSDMILGQKSFSFLYKKMNSISFPYGGTNYRFQHSYLFYCYNQTEFLKNNYQNLTKIRFVEQLDNIQSRNGFIYIIDSDWILVVV